ncbi:hypothetical protein HanRHA438_Chr14g0640551 [Helianthus annuus]|nr:hypothetical protein HanIR_Chr14g0683021 [Helianthus annuus]KAJ0852508.1 hypothetical protein HanRHA438_Chr14g0640551 [Helianthus annuus]
MVAVVRKGNEVVAELMVAVVRRGEGGGGGVDGGGGQGRRCRRRCISFNLAATNRSVLWIWICDLC